MTFSSWKAVKGIESITHRMYFKLISPQMGCDHMKSISWFYDCVIRLLVNTEVTARKERVLCDFPFLITTNKRNNSTQWYSVKFLVSAAAGDVLRHKATPFLLNAINLVLFWNNILRVSKLKTNKPCVVLKRGQYCSDFPESAETCSLSCQEVFSQYLLCDEFPVFKMDLYKFRLLL